MPSYLNSGGPGSEGGAAVRTVRPAGGSLCRSGRGLQRPQLTRAQRAVAASVPRTLPELQGDPEREVPSFLFLEGGWKSSDLTDAAKRGCLLAVCGVIQSVTRSCPMRG